MNRIFNSAFHKLIIVLFLATSAACTVRKEKTEKEGLIPEDDFVSVLSDIHIADGLLILPNIRNLYEETDSIQNYVDIIKSHGYTKEEMDRTIRYYFVKKPKKLIKIYDAVLAKLSEMEAYYASREQSGETNFWKGDSLYYFPGSDTLLFDHQFKSFGFYTLNFTLTLYPDDQSVNPRFLAYFCHPDSILNGKREYYPSLKYIKDGRPHNYSFFRKPTSVSYTHLRGWFVYSENNLRNTERHLRIDNIRLNFLQAAK